MLDTLIRQAGDGTYEPTEPGITIRDLGVTEATGGDYTLLLVRIEQEGAYIEHLHRHDERFSLAYVLSGWLQVEFQEIGIQMLGPGTVVPAFNGPTHHELDAGDGLELLLLITQKDMIGNDREKIVLQFEGDTPEHDNVLPGFLCRDFGLTELTGGRLTARRLTAMPGTATNIQWHHHQPDVQFVYVARGWFEGEYNGSGTVRLEQGALAVHHPGVPHMSVAHSDDLVLIEITAPANYATEMAATPTPGEAATAR